MKMVNALCILALVVAPASASSLRGPNSSVSLGANSSVSLVAAHHGAVQKRGDPESSIKTPKEIAKKWNGMGDVMEILFVIGCRSKHQKDVHGAAAHSMKKDGLSTDQFMDLQAKIQAGNVQDLKAACGNIVAKQSLSCRSGCAERWNEMMEKRNECDNMCVDLYGKFEKQCGQKSEDLVTIYKMQLQEAQAKQRCLTTLCNEFPTVWTMNDEEKQNKEVKDQCKKRCTEKKIEQRCKSKFALNADMIDAKVSSACAEESGVSECAEKKSKDAGGKRDDCNDKTEGKCKDQHKDCMGKGPKGQVQETCDSRKTMCMEKAKKGCSEDFKKALDKLKKECEKEGEEEYVKCKEEKMEKEEKDAVDKCKKAKKETCPEDCAKKCKVPEMNACVKKFTTDPKDDPTNFFCEKMWNFIHTTSDVTETGNPIVP